MAKPCEECNLISRHRIRCSKYEPPPALSVQKENCCAHLFQIGDDYSREHHTACPSVTAGTVTEVEVSPLRDGYVTGVDWGARPSQAVETLITINALTPGPVCQFGHTPKQCAVALNDNQRKVLLQIPRRYGVDYSRSTAAQYLVGHGLVECEAGEKSFFGGTHKRWSLTDFGVTVAGEVETMERARQRVQEEFPISNYGLTPSECLEGLSDTARNLLRSVAGLGSITVSRYYTDHPHLSVLRSLTAEGLLSSYEYRKNGVPFEKWVVSTFGRHVLAVMPDTAQSAKGYRLVGEWAYGFPSDSERSRAGSHDRPPLPDGIELSERDEGRIGGLYNNRIIAYVCPGASDHPAWQQLEVMGLVYQGPAPTGAIQPEVPCWLLTILGVEVAQALALRIKPECKIEWTEATWNPLKREMVEWRERTRERFWGEDSHEVRALKNRIGELEAENRALKGTRRISTRYAKDSAFRAMADMLADGMIAGFAAGGYTDLDVMEDLLSVLRIKYTEFLSRKEKE